MSANDFYSSGDQSEYKPQQSSGNNNDGQQDRGFLSTVAGGLAGGYGGHELVKS